MPQLRQLQTKVSNVPMYTHRVKRKIDTDEKRRMEESLVSYQLPEDQRQELIAKYGEATAPIGSHKSIFVPMRPKKGGGAA